MVVTVNDKEYQCANNNLKEFLNEIGFPNLDNLAIAVNESIISKETIADFKLNSNDKIILIRATYGG